MSSEHRRTHHAAYGGEAWKPRTADMKSELGTIWRTCGIASEWGPLRDVLLHEPGEELAASQSPDEVQMLAPVNIDRASAQHRAMAKAYREAGVEVHYLNPAGGVPPNQMFMADLFFMTPEGAVLARPASKIRAGEERTVSAWLTAAGVPIVRSISGNATFEGADAMWIDEQTVLIGQGIRTNRQGVRQLASILEEMGVAVHVTDLPSGTMHLMGMLRILDRDLAVVWQGRLAHAAVELLREKGFRVHFIPDDAEVITGFSLNVVTIGPRRILMPAGNPVSQDFYAGLGIDCATVSVDELAHAAGAIGCLTGVLHRGRV